MTTFVCDQCYSVLVRHEVYDHQCVSLEEADEVLAAIANAPTYSFDVEVPGDSIAAEAYNLVNGPRQASYGHPSSDFKAMGRISGAIIGRWLESKGYRLVVEAGPIEGVPFPDIEPRIVALMMTAVKLSRESAHPKRDNRVDLIGYTLCADAIVEGDSD